MTDKAAIQGDYCDLKFIKSRKVAVIQIEIPIEAASAFVAAFGTPNPATGVPVAIARLDPLAKEMVKQAPSGYDKPKRTWDQLSRAEQAGIACEDKEFLKYIGTFYSAAAIAEHGSAAACVRSYCGVMSRAELDTDEESGRAWDRLYSNYQLWKRGAAA